MPITFGDIYRDITSRLADVGIAKQQFYRKDLVNAINDAVREIQVQYVKNKNADDLLVNQTVTPSAADTDFPFLYSTSLTKPVMEEFPLSFVLYNSVVKVAESIPDATDTFSEGDTKVKGDKLYKAVSDGAAINAFDLTFKPDNIRNYYDNNGLEFKVGDIAFNQADETYWKCTTDYVNDKGETILASGAFEKVYWMEIGDAYVEATPLDFDSLFQAKLKDNLHQNFPLAIKQSTLYVAVPSVSYYISYVPEWEDIEDFSVDMDVPETMIPSIKDRAIQKLAVKIQVEIEQNDPE